MTAVCGCSHPHQAGQTWCATCDLPLNVPPASAPVAAPPGPAHEAVTPRPPAGGAQPLHGQDWRDAMRKATADLHKAQRNQRGTRPGKPITGYVLPPDTP